MTRLAAQFFVPIMAEEALHGPKKRSTSRPGPPPTYLPSRLPNRGGRYAAQNVDNIAEAAGIGLYGGTMLEGVVGTVASTNLFAALPQLAWAASYSTRWC